MDSNGEVEYEDSLTIGWVNTTPAYAKPTTHVPPCSDNVISCEQPDRGKIVWWFGEEYPIIPSIDSLGHNTFVKISRKFAPLWLPLMGGCKRSIYHTTLIHE